MRDYAAAIGVDPETTVDEFCRWFPQGDRRAERQIRGQAEIVGHDEPASGAIAIIVVTPKIAEARRPPRAPRAAAAPLPLAAEAEAVRTATGSRVHTDVRPVSVAAVGRA